jgi:hypothetical protein
MSGCTNCGSKGGCDDRKGHMFAALDDALARLYPTSTWGEVDERARHAALEPDELAALAEELAGELNAATFVRPGDDDEPCDYIYVLAFGRPPCALQVRDFGVAPPTEWTAAGAGEPVRELYLRLCVSQLAPMAGVQQVAMTATPDSDGAGWVIEEAVRAGVFDAPLLRRMQKLVALLPAYGLTHLDFGDISAPRPGLRAGAWTALYGGEPAVANFLLSPRPTTQVATTWRPRVRDE